MKPYRSLILLCLLTAIIGLSCGPTKVVRKQYVSAKFITDNAEYLKAYTPDGDLYILHNWRLDSDRVRGMGVRLDKNRDTVEQREFDISASKVALFETNTNESSLAGSGMAITMVGHAILTIYCIMNPKACFGSCPTFYASDGKEEKLMAEGFSSSILPSMEAEDIDALPQAVPNGRNLDITMKNEALETHVVRAVDIMAVPHKAGTRVFKTDDGVFYESSSTLEPTKAIGMKGDAIASIRSFDGLEYHSKTDSSDLAKKETLDFDFQSVDDGSYGIVIGCRQAFVSTYMFYQGISYLGSQAGNYMSRLENSDPAMTKAFEQFRSALGGIAVWSEDKNGNWKKDGEVTEMGPIASDIHLITVKSTNRPKHIRLVMSQGSWRIDYVAMAKLSGEVEPVIIHPSKREHTKDQVLFSDTARPAFRSDKLAGALITLPGDEYRYSFELPEHPENYDLFLRSKGYYIEWMREDWLREENPVRAALFFLDPKSTMRAEAGRFKDIEEEMETQFWRTKISHNVQ